ncbi:MAG: PstS family phosphate ABC transporter substrate-binding protein [Haliscomenobacteraceae bacterium CHB4]|nr:PstS family phosphate ABC transporter substrate-binding protein [Haliscomenobacteraceae bacterium CHB4]
MTRTTFWIGALLLFGGCPKNGNSVENIIIKGSDTEVNVALALAENFMEKEPHVSIAVTGGGSGTGIAALLSGRAHIANASRPMKPDELQMAQRRGIQPVPVIFGIDALAIIVHQNNPVDSLSIGDLGRIFRGETGNWAESGGPSMTISLYGRQSNSGTFLFFREKIVGADYAPALKQMNGTAQIVEAIGTDPAGIGYVGIGYLSGKEGQRPPNIKVLKISEKAGVPACSPLDPSQILTGQYPIVRPLYQYVNGIPDSRLLEFLLFTIGEEGQKIVSGNGYYPISKEQLVENLRLLDTEMAIK